MSMIKGICKKKKDFFEIFLKYYISDQHYKFLKFFLVLLFWISTTHTRTEH